MPVDAAEEQEVHTVAALTERLERSHGDLGRRGPDVTDEADTVPVSDGFEATRERAKGANRRGQLGVANPEDAADEDGRPDVVVVELAQERPWSAVEQVGALPP